MAGHTPTHTEPRKLARPITQTQGLLLTARRTPTPTEPRRPAQLTTQTPEPLRPRNKPPTPMGATGVRRITKMARLQPPSIRQPRKELWHRHKIQTAAKRLPARANTTVLPRVRLQTVTSMQPRTAIPTKIRGAVGARRAEALLPRATENSQRAADHRHSAAAVAAVGGAGRRAPVVRQAEAAVVDGVVVVAGEPGV